MFLERIIVRIPPAQLHAAEETPACVGCVGGRLDRGVVEPGLGECLWGEIGVSGGLEWERWFGSGFGSGDGCEGFKSGFEGLHGGAGQGPRVEKMRGTLLNRVASVSPSRLEGWMATS